jgi:hypothetical protein
LSFAKIQNQTPGKLNFPGRFYFQENYGCCCPEDGSDSDLFRAVKPHEYAVKISVFAI